MPTSAGDIRAIEVMALSTIESLPAELEHVEGQNEDEGARGRRRGHAGEDKDCELRDPGAIDADLSTCPGAGRTELNEDF